MNKANLGKPSKRYQDLTDRKFAKLKVVRAAPDRIRKNGTKQKMWIVQCECGSSEFEILGTALTQKARPTKQCSSCASKIKIANNLHRFPKNSKPHNYEDLTGMTFGLIKVIGSAGFKTILSRGKNHRQNQWDTICTKCGEEKIRTTAQVRRVKGCSLCGKKSGLAHPNFKGGPLLSLFRSQKRRALEDRDMTWTIDYEFFSRVIVKNCFYCNAAPNLTSRGVKDPINTLDRYDSRRGYEPENVVPCCRDCNLAKRDMHGDEFVQLVKRIAAHLGAKKGEK